MDQENRDDAGAARSQHLIHVLARDDARAATLLLPALDRIDAAVAEPQFVALTPDRDSAAALAESLNRLSAGRYPPVVPVTSLARGATRLQGGVRALVATAADAVALMGLSALKLERVRTAAVVWGDLQFGESGRATLETVISALPREADRLLLVTALGDEVEAFATGFMWRARRMSHEAPPALGTPIQFLACAPSSRAAVVRQLLDLWNPQRTAIAVVSPDGRRDAEQLLAGLGYGADDPSVAVLDGLPADSYNLVVFFEVPADLPALSALAGVDHVVALVEPRSLAGFLHAASGNAMPLVFTSALRDAHAAEDALRDELRSALQGRPLVREILTLEPLLGDTDPVHLAAAALRLLEQERATIRRPSAAPRDGGGAPPRSEGPAARNEAPAMRREAHPTTDPRFVRVFVNVGQRDGAGPGDLVGAITGEAQVDGSQLGKIELRETFALVEVARDVSEKVVQRLTGTSLKGRRVEARIDQGPRDKPDRPPRRDFRPGGAGRGESGPPRGRGGFGGRGRDDDRGRGRPDARSGGRGRDDGARGAPRSDSRGPSRGGRDDWKGLDRGRDAGRTPRAMHEKGEWKERGDRLRSARKPRRDDA